MTNVILNEVLSLRKGITVCWLGNASWLVHAEGRLTEERFAWRPVEAEGSWCG